MAALPAGFAEVQGAEMRRAAGELLSQRLVLIPMVASITVTHWYVTGGSRAKFLLICAFYAAVFLHLAILRWRYRRGIDPRTLGVAATVAGLGACSLTGGLDSPFLIVLPLSAGLTAMGGPSRREAWVAAAVAACGLPLLSLAGGTRPILSAGLVVFGIVAGLCAGVTMRGMFDRMLARALQAQQDVLQLHSEQLQALTTLSGQIAHELKTPLASIKGLTGLAALEIRDRPRAAERLEILRGEAGRMEELLGELGHFSRPFSPLSPETVDGLRLGEDIVDLFRGLAHERKLSLELSGSSVELRCDRRKVRQVLINLVQNAVEASSPGGEIRIDVEPREEKGAIRVLDRGHGLSEEIAGRVFDPGTTTKPRGSGLGLAVARGIAEQHGGTLRLRAREGGGCVAELVLPAAAASPESRAA